MLVALSLRPSPSPSPVTVPPSSDQSVLQAAAAAAAAAGMSVAVRGLHPARRPRLSLQTCIVSQASGPTPSSLQCGPDTPTTRNTVANTYPSPSTAAASAQSASTCSSSSSFSPYPTVPYTSSQISRSVLRNGPIPRMPRSATSTRLPKPMFPAAKRVVFAENLTTAIPPPAAADWSSSESDSDPDAAGTSSQKRRRRSANEGRERTGTDDQNGTGGEDDGTPSTPVLRKPKRRREWTWTLDDSAEKKNSPAPGEKSRELSTSPSRVPLPATPATPH